MTVVNLWEKAPGLCEEPPVLEIYVPENKKTDKAVVILPGGGYAMRAEHEGKGYAEFLNKNGIVAFVCQYRVSPHKFPLPLLDARRAVRYVRYHSKDFGINENEIYVMGSSAGGHLAALLSTYYKELEFENIDEIDKIDYKPNGQILCYPVIELLGKGITDFGTGKCLLGEDLPWLGEELSPSKIADETAPKAFIWHTFTDAGVNVINSLNYAKRLREMNVNTELHVYSAGPHGLGLAEDVPHVCNWSGELIEWLNL